MRRLLWTDDDGEDWFVYEAHLIAQAGWEIVWAPDVVSAVALLQESRFDALVLDQMLPWQQRSSAPNDTIQIWGGCTVLWWLRRQQWPASAPFPTRIRDLPIWSQRPLPHNQDTPAIFVSAFYDEKIEQVARDASAQDAMLSVLAKPVLIDDLQHFLRQIPRRT